VKILYIAEVVGKAGIYAVKKGLGPLKEKYKAEFTVLNGNGATGGNGLGRNHAAYIRKLGADCVTLGFYAFYKKDLVENIARIPYVLRPWNLNPACPGAGMRVFKTASGAKIAVAVLLGMRGGRLLGSNPFADTAAFFKKLKEECPLSIVEFSGTASGEKRIFFEAARGCCTAAIGAGTRVQTADEAVIEGTAVITDAGRTGSACSVGGAETESRVREYLTGIPDWTREAWEQPEIQGLLIEADSKGRALSVKRIKEPVEPANSALKENSEENSA